MKAGQHEISRKEAFQRLEAKVVGTEEDDFCTCFSDLLGVLYI